MALIFQLAKEKRQGAPGCAKHQNRAHGAVTMAARWLVCISLGGTLAPLGACALGALRFGKLETFESSTSPSTPLSAHTIHGGVAPPGRRARSASEPNPYSRSESRKINLNSMDFWSPRRCAHDRSKPQRATRKCVQRRECKEDVPREKYKCDNAHHPNPRWLGNNHNDVGSSVKIPTVCPSMMLSRPNSSVVGGIGANHQQVAGFARIETAESHRYAR